LTEVVGKVFIVVDDGAPPAPPEPTPPTVPAVAVIVFEAGAGNAIVELFEPPAPTVPVIFANVVKGTS
jgi:hypothetical protein